jgi:hypothetical protein
VADDVYEPDVADNGADGIADGIAHAAHYGAVVGSNENANVWEPATKEAARKWTQTEAAARHRRIAASSDSGADSGVWSGEAVVLHD